MRRCAGLIQGKIMAAVHPAASTPDITTEKSRKAIYAASIGNSLEWYDFGVYAYLATLIAVSQFRSHRVPAGRLCGLWRGFYGASARRHRHRPHGRREGPQGRAGAHHLHGGDGHCGHPASYRPMNPSAWPRPSYWGSCTSSRALRPGASGAPPPRSSSSGHRPTAVVSSAASSRSARRAVCCSVRPPPPFSPVASAANKCCNGAGAWRSSWAWCCCL